MDILTFRHTYWNYYVQMEVDFSHIARIVRLTIATTTLFGKVSPIALICMW